LRKKASSSTATDAIRKGKGIGIWARAVSTAEALTTSLQLKSPPKVYTPEHCRQRVPEQTTQPVRLEQEADWQTPFWRVVSLGQAVGQEKAKATRSEGQEVQLGCWLMRAQLEQL
jgi:hypothetical protein